MVSTMKNDLGQTNFYTRHIIKFMQCFPIYFESLQIASCKMETENKFYFSLSCKFYVLNFIFLFN